jgi:RNA recognition motif-containing protein
MCVHARNCASPSACPRVSPFVCCRFGPLNRVEIKRNYAFVEFRELDDAIEAQKRSHGTNFDGRTITVEFVESSRLGKDRCGMPTLARLGLSIKIITTSLFTPGVAKLLPAPGSLHCLRARLANATRQEPLLTRLRFLG